VKNCITCTYYDDGKCEEAGKVIDAHGSDKLEKWTENPMKNNNCSIYKTKAIKKALPDKPEKDTRLPIGAHRASPKGYPESKKDYAIPSEYKYPIDTVKHVRAAISYFSKTKNAGQYTVSEQKSIWERIKGAAKKFGIKLSEKSGPESVEKSYDERGVRDGTGPYKDSYQRKKKKKGKRKEDDEDCPYTKSEGGRIILLLKAGKFGVGTSARAKRNVYAEGIMDAGYDSDSAYAIATSAVKKGAKPAKKSTKVAYKKEMKRQKKEKKDMED